MRHERQSSLPSVFAPPRDQQGRLSGHQDSTFPRCYRCLCSIQTLILLIWVQLSSHLHQGSHAHFLCHWRVQARQKSSTWGPGKVIVFFFYEWRLFPARLSRITGLSISVSPATWDSSISLHILYLFIIGIIGLVKQSCLVEHHLTVKEKANGQPYKL